MSAELYIDEEIAIDVWLEYERRKDLLPLGLTPFEYEQELERITTELGI